MLETILLALAISKTVGLDELSDDYSEKIRENMEQLGNRMEYLEDYVINMKGRNAREKHNLEKPQQTGRKTRTYLVETKTVKHQKTDHDMEIMKDYQDTMMMYPNEYFENKKHEENNFEDVGYHVGEKVEVLYSDPVNDTHAKDTNLDNTVSYTSTKETIKNQNVTLIKDKTKIKTKLTKENLKDVITNKSKETNETLEVNHDKNETNAETQRKWWREHPDGSQDVALDTEFPCGSLPYEEDGLRIIGGQEAVAHSYPWIARIWGGCAEGLCAGTLVTSQHLVYAFHCTYHPDHGQEEEGPCDHSDGKRLAAFGLHMLRYDLNSWKEYYTKAIIDVKVPPHYNLDKDDLQTHDFALGVLDSPVQFSPRIRPICIPHQGMEFYGEMSIAAGWGRTASFDPLRPETSYQSLHLKDVELVVSEKHYQHTKMFGTGVVGLGGQTEHDPCSGDSGGPLMWRSPDRWVLIGTLQGSGFNCNTGKYVNFENSDNGLWNNVAEHSDWIKRTIADQSFE